MSTRRWWVGADLPLPLDRRIERDYDYRGDDGLMGWVTGPYSDGHWTATINEFRDVKFDSEAAAKAFVELMAQ